MARVRYIISVLASVSRAPRLLGTPEYVLKKSILYLLEKLKSSFTLFFCFLTYISGIQHLQFVLCSRPVAFMKALV